MVALGGHQAWAVFGEIGLTGLDASVKKLGKFDKAGQGMTSMLTDANPKLLAVGAGVATLGLAVGAFAVKGAKDFADFDAAMTQSLAIMGDVSEAAQQDMVRAAKEMGSSTLFSATQAAESYFFLASAGLSAEQSIAALPQVAAFAQAGMFDMARATDLATDAQSALGLTVDDAEKNLENLSRVTDVLVKANTLANASVEQFAEALTNKAGAALNVTNKSIEEGVAVLAAYADRGVKAGLAGERFNILLRDLPDAANNNKKAFEALGISIFDSEGNMRNMADIIEDFERSLGPLSDAQTAAAFEALGLNKRVADSIRILFGASEAIREYEGELGDAGGTSQEVAEKQLGTLNSQWKLMTDKVSVLAMALGGPLAENLESTLVLVNKLLDGVIRFTEWLGKTSIADSFAGTKEGADQASSSVGTLTEATEDLTAANNENKPTQDEIITFLTNLTTSAEESAQGVTGLADSLLSLAAVSEELNGAMDFATLDKLVGKEGEIGKLRKMLLDENLALEDRIDIMNTLVSLRSQLSDSVQNSETDVATFGVGLDDKNHSQFLHGPNQGRLIDEPAKEVGARAVKSLKEGFDLGMEKIGPEVHRAGQDIIRGLISGQLSMGDILKKTVLNIAANFILGPLNKFFGIASPSRVLAGVGGHLMVGLAEGIEAEKASLHRVWMDATNLPNPTASLNGAVRASRGFRADTRRSIDFSTFPKATNPLAASRDTEWQEFLRHSFDHAVSEGFSP